MLRHIIILISMLSPIVLSAQLQVDSKQVSKVISIAPPESAEIMYHMRFDTPAPECANSQKSIYMLNFQPVNTNYAYQPKHYGVFCKIESKIESKSKLSPRFRLGSSAYVDMLEGKGREWRN